MGLFDILRRTKEEAPEELSVAGRDNQPEDRATFERADGSREWVTDDALNAEAKLLSELYNGDRPMIEGPDGPVAGRR